MINSPQSADSQEEATVYAPMPDLAEMFTPAWVASAYAGKPLPAAARWARDFDPELSERFYQAWYWASKKPKP